MGLLARIFTPLTLLLLALPVAASGHRLSAYGQLQAQTEVALVLKWKHQFQFAGYYAALEKGYYNDAGIHVQIEEAPTFGDPVEAVVNGQAAFGISGSDLLLEYDEGHPVVALAALFQHSPVVIVASQAAGVDNVRQLAGKRLMLEPRSYELLAYLGRQQVSTESMTIVTRPPILRC